MGSGGKKANLAAILEGKGGQQNKQHISEKLSPIPLILNYKYESLHFFISKSQVLWHKEQNSSQLGLLFINVLLQFDEIYFHVHNKNFRDFHTAVSLPKADSEVSERKQQQSEGGSQPQYLVGKNSMLISNSTCKQSKNVKNSQSRKIQSRLKSSLVTLFCLGTHRLF